MTGPARGAEVAWYDDEAGPVVRLYAMTGGRTIIDRDGLALIQRVERAGVERLGGVEIWGATGPRELLATGGGAAYVLRPERLVLATGAYERGVPLPGWTLPGFLTTGAAQTFLRAYGVLPGRRVLVSGNGPLNIQVAAEMARAGGEIVAVGTPEVVAANDASYTGQHLSRLLTEPAQPARAQKATRRRERVSVG